MRRTTAALEGVSLAVASGAKPKRADIVQHLEKMPEAQMTTLSNGFRVVTKETGGTIASAGVFIDAGSRFETWETNGTAHFLEHMTFKGSRNYTRAQLEQYYELTAGELNAFTTREQTVYLANTFSNQVGESISRISDILRYPNLTPADIESERNNIIMEKEDVEMTIEEVMMDNVHLTCFPNDGLGMTILGTLDNITTNINRQMIQDYMRTHYTAKRMIMVGGGGVKHDDLVRIAEANWGDLPAEPAKPSLGAKFVGDRECVVEYSGIVPNLTAVWGICGQSEPEILTAQVLQYFLGKYERQVDETIENSVLHKIADSMPADKGVVERIEAFTTLYSDASLFGVYLVNSPGSSQSDDNLRGFQMEVIRRIIAAVEDMTEETLQNAKESFVMACLLMIDGSTTLIDTLGITTLSHGRDIPLVEFYGRVDAITLDDVRRFVAKYIAEKPFVLTGVGERSQLPQGGNCKDYLWNKDASFQPAAYAL